MQLQRVELQRTIDLLTSLSDADWSAATDCPAWNVHHMYLHVLAACEAATSVKQNLHQLRAAKRRQKSVGGALEAALSSVQVAERLHIAPADLVDRLIVVAPITVRKRTKLPAVVRRLKMKVDGPVAEKWSLGYLVDTIYLRDLWMHRVDAARATGRQLVLTADHDGRVVADVAAEWARRHGQAVAITLTGAAGGTFAFHGSGDSAAPIVTLELDAVEFCRTLAGRAAGAGLLSTIVPF